MISILVTQVNYKTEILEAKGWGHISQSTFTTYYFRTQFQHSIWTPTKMHRDSIGISSVYSALWLLPVVEHELCIVDSL